MEPITEELKCLNSLEQHLTTLHIPFPKMTALPKDGQHGPAICVPSHVEKTTTISRRYGSDQMIRVQLKRKISYKRYDENKLVNKAHVQDALNYLVRNNSMLLF